MESVRKILGKRDYIKTRREILSVYEAWSVKEREHIIFSDENTFMVLGNDSAVQLGIKRAKNVRMIVLDQHRSCSDVGMLYVEEGRTVRCNDDAVILDYHINILNPKLLPTVREYFS